MKNILKIEISPNRIFGLDILRAFAISFVMLTHGSRFLPKELVYFNNKLSYDGVGIFFVLSGFLIGGILIKLLNHNKINKVLLLNFWIRRWARTLPNYYLILCILFIFNIIINSNFNPFQHISYFFFLQNLTSTTPPFFDESWSLAVEEWFYIITPLLLFLLIKLFKLPVKFSILLSIILIILLVNLYRYIYYLNLDDHTFNAFIQIRYSVLGRLDCLMYGVLGAYIYHFYHNFWNKYKVLFLVIGILLIFISYTVNLNYFFRMTFSFTFTSISILLLLPFLNSVKTGKGIFYKIITYISLTSYSLYLVNMQVSNFLEHSIDWNKIVYLYHVHISANHAWTIILLLNYTLFWAISIMLSILLYKYFEVPTMKLRDYFKIKQN